ECAHLVAPDRVRGCLAIFGPTHMQGCAIEIDLRPFEVAKLASSQSMSIRHEKHRRISMPVPVSLCGFDQLPNLSWGQVFTATIFAIRESCWCHCSVFDIRLHQLETRVHSRNSMVRAHTDRTSASKRAVHRVNSCACIVHEIAEGGANYTTCV